VLGHLSGENNFPELAQTTVSMCLREAGIGEDEIVIDVARRGAFTGVYSLKEVSYAGR